MGKWVQINDANWKVPYIGGWCEGYVEMAWGKATMNDAHTATYGIYPSAIQAWEAVPEEHRHYDLPPLGITVPVYFTLGSVWQGHTAIRLDDGMVASSTQGGYHSQGFLHPDIQNMIDLFAKYNGGCTYLGWADRQWGIDIVKYVPDITYKDVTEVTNIPFKTVTKDDNSIPKGGEKTSVIGINGKQTKVFTITYSDGVQTAKTLKSDSTIHPVDEVILIGTYVAPEQTPMPEPIQTIPISADTELAKDTNQKVTIILSFVKKIWSLVMSLFKLIKGAK